MPTRFFHLMIPKTDYLSTRPQFLRYRPNPRIEVYLHKEKSKRLEDCFLTEGFSDTEASEEIESKDSNKESEDDSSAEIINEEEEEPHDFKPHPIKTDEEKKTVLKPQFFPESKSIALLLQLEKVNDPSVEKANKESEETKLEGHEIEEAHLTLEAEVIEHTNSSEVSRIKNKNQPALGKFGQ
ncbi:hypothetical protein U1Q18_006714 [Sarracenia purpurea var. burkii]